MNVDGRVGGPQPDLRLWGKVGTLPRPYPLVCHLLDTGAAAEVLWRDVLPASVAGAVARGLGVSREDAGRLVAFWAALHDIGKITPGFQMQVRSAFAELAGYSTAGARKDFRHDSATQVWLGRVLGEIGYPNRRMRRDSAFQVAQILGGHHGCFSPLDRAEFLPANTLPQLGGAEWEEQRRATLRAIRELFDPPDPPGSVDVTAAALVCAIVILSDWLVSQEDFLTERLQSVPVSSQVAALREHRAGTARLAVDLVTGAGISEARLQKGSFEQEFPGFSPNSLQRSVAETLPGLLSGPGLLLVMAPMGVGKTETALHAARVMGDASGTSGLFMTLPTMATADQMYTRVREYAARRLDGDAALTLLHSMAWLNTAYAPSGTSNTSNTSGAGDHDGGDTGAAVLTGDGDPSPESKVAATEWLRGRKRGLLAPLAVGTVDQALLTVLPVKHNVLRMLGLAGKTLIVDEVHAYDAYMQYLLARLLAWLGAMRVPVVLLSATLPGSVAQRLVRAYLGGARGSAWRESVDVVYPGWLYADALSGTVTVHPVATPSRSLAVDTVVVPVEAKSGADRASALRTLLRPLVLDRGCAMVVCTTVAEAQATYSALGEWFDEMTREAGDGDGDGDEETDRPGLLLLHARFPARKREQVTARVVSLFGRDPSARPRAAVLVATQVAEQSLDLDFDLVVSDLAPVAQLLQRAGRCQRHPAVDAHRPGWAAPGPRLAVLVPPGAGEDLDVPDRWAAVYDRSLLGRTHTLLMERGGRGVRIPEDVQDMVERVYKDIFSIEMTEHEMARLMEDEARTAIAEMTAIRAPRDVAELSELTKKEIVEERISTRLDADSVRVVCCFVDVDGNRWLDPDRKVALPVAGTGAAGAFTADDVRTILSESIPVRYGPWLHHDRSIIAIPDTWAEHPSLRDLVLLPHPVGPDGVVGAVDVGGYNFRLNPVLGLTW